MIDIMFNSGIDALGGLLDAAEAAQVRGGVCGGGGGSAGLLGTYLPGALESR